MEKQRFTCSAEQWSFARAYSYVAVPNALTKPIKTTGMSWLALPAIFFIIGAIGSIIFMHWLWIVSITLSFVIALISFQRQATQNDALYIANYEYADPQQHDIPLMSVSAQKIHMHLFRPDGSSSHQLNLHEIDRIAITMLNLTARTQKLPFLINKRAEQLGLQTTPLLYGRTDTYQLTVYTRQKALFQSAITIPNEWLATHTFAQLIDCLANHSITIEDTTAPNSLIKRYFNSYNIQLPAKRR